MRLMDDYSVDFFCCLFFFESISNAFLIRFLTSFVVVDFAVLVIGATTTTTKITKITAATRAKLLIHFHAPPSLVVYLYNKQKKKKIKIGRKNGEKTCWRFDVISDFFKTFFCTKIVMLFYYFSPAF